jgi:GDP-L-fucose synthase
MSGQSNNKSNQPKIFVAGHRGMVGSATVRALKAKGYDRILTCSRSELDLRNAEAVRAYFKAERPDWVVLAAARVGGILGNADFQPEMLLENLQIQNAVIDAAVRVGCDRLLFLGSSCIYPKFASQPISEDALLTGALEETNEGYALAKIAGLKLCQFYNRDRGKRFVSVMPSNLYGPGDNFHPIHSHMVPGLIRRFHEAKVSGAQTVTVWGTGTPRRELLYVDDLAEAVVLVLESYSGSMPLNVGVGEDHTIAEIAAMIQKVVGFKGEIVFDTTKPDGTPRKLLDVSRIQKKLGWKAKTPLYLGLQKTYQWFLENYKDDTHR